MSNPLCPGCNSPYTDRVRRIGLLENTFLPLLGFYPWRCEDCVTVFLCRARRKPRPSTHTQSYVRSLPHTQH